MLRLILVVVLATPLFAQQHEDSVALAGHDNADDAAAQVRYNELGSVVPTRIATEWHQAPRTSWISIAPHWTNGKNLVASSDSPAPNVSKNHCQQFGVSPHYSAWNFSSWQARESAWNNLAPLVRSHAAKLALPVGEVTAYVLLVPTVYATDCGSSRR